MIFSVKVEGGIVVDRIVGEAEGYIRDDTAQIGWVEVDGELVEPIDDYEEWISE